MGPIRGTPPRLLHALLGPDRESARQGFYALLISSGGDLLAGVTLGSIQHTLETLPGLLVLIPAAIGMRGNIFGALGSRLGTAIHTGTFTLTPRRSTVVGQNVLSSLSLTFAVSLALAALAKTIALAFDLRSISLLDFVVISMVGGVISSAVVLAITVGVAAGSARFGWDMDSVAAPVITAAGDMVTLPALFLATYCVGLRFLSPLLGALTAGLAVASLVGVVRSGLPLFKRIVAESLPILLIAGAIDIIAGITIEKRLEAFTALPALLVLVPPFLEDTGALGGILAARLSSKLHLGVIEPTVRPQRAARADFRLVAVLAVPVFILVAVSSDLVSLLFGLASPGPVRMIGISLVGGMLATTACLAITYYGAIAAYRLGLDPDNHGIPLVTSSMDLIGAVALIFAILLLGAG
ncbi:MAG TPA: magnesium transporter [Acidimicrobiia bacterium]|nr:magnesium transporter [Acidimicrobiia bacterium]